jgi:hypothetical protein
MPVLFAVALGLLLVLLGERAWAAIGQIEQALAEADRELENRD